MNLVVSATGILGSEICRQLRHVPGALLSLMSPVVALFDVEEYARRVVQR